MVGGVGYQGVMVTEKRWGQPCKPQCEHLPLLEDITGPMSLSPLNLCIICVMCGCKVREVIKRVQLWITRHLRTWEKKKRHSITKELHLISFLYCIWERCLMVCLKHAHLQIRIFSPLGLRPCWPESDLSHLTALSAAGNINPNKHTQLIVSLPNHVWWRWWQWPAEQWDVLNLQNCSKFTRPIHSTAAHTLNKVKRVKWMRRMAMDWELPMAWMTPRLFTYSSHTLHILFTYRKSDYTVHPVRSTGVGALSVPVI